MILDIAQPCHHIVFVNVKQDWTWIQNLRAQERENGGGRPGLSVPNSPYGLCGRKATLEEKKNIVHSEWADLA